MADVEVYPVKPGDWVTHRTNHNRFGRIKDVMIENGETLVHIVLYSCDGTKIGRASPVLGGPRSFEPCCDYSDWHRIDPPEFPVTLKWIDNDGTMMARYYSGPALPNREWIRPNRARKRSMPNFDAEREIAALLRSAQELRDAARRHEVPEMINRAIELEKEAQRLRMAL